MKKFSKTNEKLEEKEFIVEARITLKITSENSGEAGYLSDSILGSIEFIDNFEVIKAKSKDLDCSI